MIAAFIVYQQGTLVQSYRPITQSTAHQLQQIAVHLQDHMNLYGYQLIETPIIEDADLFLTKAGDTIAEQLFTFERYGHVLALRPEFTAAAARMYARNHAAGKVVRWQFSGPIFVDNPQQSGRSQYQQNSAGAELIGMAGPAADAEITGMAVNGLNDYDLRDWTLLLGHVGLTRRLLARYELDERTQRFILNHRHLLRNGDAGRDKLFQQMAAYFPHDYRNRADDSQMTQDNTQQVLDTLLDSSRGAQTMGGRSREDIARRLLRKRQQAAQQAQIEEAVYFLQGWMNIRSSAEWALDEIENHIGNDGIAQTIYSEWRESLTLLDAYQISFDNIVIQPDLARNWDYYTGMIFELRTDSGALLAGGGRYDDLTRLLGAEEMTPAVGFAYDLDHIVEALTTPRPAPPRLIYLAENIETCVPAAHWAHMLRQRGVAIALVDQAPANAAVTLTVEDDGRARLGNRTYAFDEIELLVTTLNGR